MNAQEKYEIIKELTQNGNKLRASLKLGCTVRHVNRLIQKYRLLGKAAFIHGNTGRQQIQKISDALHQILHMYGIPGMFFSNNPTVFEYRKKIPLP